MGGVEHVLYFKSVFLEMQISWISRHDHDSYLQVLPSSGALALLYCMLEGKLLCLCHLLNEDL